MVLSNNAPRALEFSRHSVSTRPGLTRLRRRVGLKPAILKNFLERRQRQRGPAHLKHEAHEIASASVRARILVVCRLNGRRTGVSRNESAIQALERSELRRQAKPNTAIYLSSPGGSLIEGLKLGYLFKEMRIKTVVEGDRPNNLCASACALAFLGGHDSQARPWRSSTTSSLLGYHQFYCGDGQQCRDEQAAVSVILRFVADTGTGIPPDKLNNVFDAFYSTKVHATGLGLSIARTIVQNHSGRIWAENRSEGGALLRFTLPLSKTAQAPRASGWNLTLGALV